MITRIHVNRQKIAQNRRAAPADRQPVISIKAGDSNIYAFEAEIEGPSRVVYRPENPLKCGAVLWIETEAGVHVLR